MGMINKMSFSEVCISILMFTALGYLGILCIRDIERYKSIDWKNPSEEDKSYVTRMDI